MLCPQRHAAHAAASAAQAAGATQRALARSQAAVDPTDIDATLAAASLSSSETPRARHADSLTTASSTVAEDTAASRSLWAADDPRPAPVKPLQLFGASGFEGGAGRAHSDAGRTVDVEYQLTVEVQLRALQCICRSSALTMGVDGPGPTPDVCCLSRPVTAQHESR